MAPAIRLVTTLIVIIEPDGSRGRDPQPGTGQSSGSPVEEKQEGLYEGVCRGVKNMTGKPKETTDVSLWELTDSGQIAGKLAWD